MRDVTLVSCLYCLLFTVLIVSDSTTLFGMSLETSQGLLHFIADLIFWAAALYICASGTMGAFARQDRFGLSQNHPMANRFMSLLLLFSPFLAVLWDARFVYALLGLLAFSHIKSKTPEEMKIAFKKSRTQSNILLLMLFTLAMMMMAWHDYPVGSIFDFGSTSTTETQPLQNPDNA